MANPEEFSPSGWTRSGRKGWYEADPAWTRGERAFRCHLASAQEGGFALWLTYPSGTLAYIILNDQFPRNMFRGQGEAFASDPIALAAAKMAIARGWDMKIDPPARQFFYMPLMHSESLSDQDRCVRMFLTRMRETGGQPLALPRAPRGDPPLRPLPVPQQGAVALQPPGEADFLASGGYGATVRALEGAEGADAGVERAD